jgi:hypothetical protein
VSLAVSDLDNEGLNSVVLTFRDKPRIEHTMIRCFTETSWPKLGGTNAWGVDDKFFRAIIICGCSLQLRYVTSMAKFGLDVCSSDLEVVGLWNPVL